MARPDPTRQLARMIAYKRIVTGVLSYCAAIGLTVATIMHGGAPPLYFALAITIFLGGGTWALRDGVRLRRELLTSAGASASSSAS